jgi:hypothetical protein
MGNCLVTKLKGVVNNDNLEKLGSISLYPKGITGAPIQTFNIYSSTPYTAEIIGGDYNFVGPNGESLGELKKVTVPVGSTLYISGYCLPANANNGHLEISNKYNFTNISPSDVDGYTMEVDLNSIKYMPELRVLSIPQNAALIHLDFENIPATLTSLSIRIPGDLSKLAYNPNLTSVVLDYSYSEGEVNVSEVFPNLT